MKEYIDRQEAIESSLAFLVEYLGGAFDEGLQEKLKTKINTIPAADVTPVVHSTWIENGDPLMLTCGNCGYGVMRYNNTRFCPNCGAKMDGGES